MLKGSFYNYSLLETGSGVVKAHILLNKEHNLYQGHFPEMPIVPGVCQVQIIKEIFEDVIGRKFKVKTAKDIKFLAMINPVEIDNFYCDIDYTATAANTMELKATLFVGEKKLLRLRASLA